MTDRHTAALLLLLLLAVLWMYDVMMRGSDG